MLNDEGRARITQAIEAAEAKTAGEIFCVLAEEVSAYREVPLAWGAGIAFAVPPLFMLLGLHRLALAGIFTSWTDDSARAMEGLILRVLGTYGLVQAGLFVCIVLIVMLPGIRRAMTPGILKSHRVRKAARHHFVAAGARLSDAEPHILIFAAMKERRVELVAHEAIHRAVGDTVWNQAVAAVTAGMKSGDAAAGFVRAIEICGAALAAHYPAEGAPANRLPNTILET
jgi:putative membrane protein